MRFSPSVSFFCIVVVSLQFYIVNLACGEGLEITRQPLSRTIYVGEDAVFSVGVEGEVGQLHYRWFKNGVSVGADSDELTIQNSQIADNGSTIYCRVSDNESSISTDSVALSVLDPVKYGVEFRVNSYTTNDQSYPSISSNGTNYLICWSSVGQDSDGRGIYAQLLDNEGSKFASEFQVNSCVIGDQTAQAEASDGENYLVVWHSVGQDGSGAGVYAQLLDNEGVKIGSEFRVNSYTVSDQFYPSVASNGENYLVVWHSMGQDGSGAGVYARLLDNEGGKIGSEFRVNSYTSSDQFYPSVASDGGNYLVVWCSLEQDGDGAGVYGQLVSNEGVKVGLEFRVNSCTDNSQESPFVESNGTSYLITWYSVGQDGDGAGVYGQLVSNEGIKLGAEFRVNSYTINSQSSPSISSDLSNYLVVWQSYAQDGDRSGVYGQISDNEGNLVGAEFLVNTQISNSQSFPSTASNGENYLVVWMSNSQDGDGHGIYAKTLKYSVLEIFWQPFPKTVYIGDSVTFYTGAIGGVGDLNYRWYKNSEPVGSDSDTLVLTGLQLSDNDSTIYCVVSDSDNESVTTQQTLLTVLATVTITKHPESRSVYAGEPVTFSVVADTQSGDLRYRWYKNDIPIGSDSNELLIQAPQITDNDSSIYCKVSNYCSTVKSDTAVLTVLNPAFKMIISGPRNTVENKTFSYTAYAKYGTDEYIVTDFSVWSVSEPDNFAEFVVAGDLEIGDIDEDKNITIRATFTDGEETHWCDFDVAVDNLFQVVSMSPLPDKTIMHAPYNIELILNEDTDNDTVNSNNCYLVAAGKDGLLNTSDDSPVDILSYLSDNRRLILDLSGLLPSNDIYQVKLSGIKNIDGDSLDGDFSGTFPSGDGTLGGDFMASFILARQITSISLVGGVASIEWAPFRDNLVYRVEQTSDLNSPDWVPVEPVGQWPITETTYIWSVSDNDSRMFFRVHGCEPHIDTVTPSSGAKGSFSLSVNIKGYGTGWTDVTVGFGDGITVDSVDLIDSSNVTVIVRISLSAETGYRDIVLTDGSDTFMKKNGFAVTE